VSGERASLPRLLVATRNPGKLRELRTILTGVPVELVGLADAGAAEPPEVEETGATFLENALIKARAYAAWAGMAAIADDSGLEVDALGGAPGVRSSRYAGQGATDQANLDLLLQELAGVPPERRGARFRCAAVLADPLGAGPEGEGPGEGLGEGLGEGPGEGPPSSPGTALRPREWSAEAAWEGRLLDEPRGSGGFGYDPVFVPDGWNLTSAEVDEATKDAASHRGRAFRALRPAIQAWASGRFDRSHG
jgi:XTP/dITP diphosphohydrolase